GTFGTDPETAFRRGDGVLVRTDRGLEVGEVLCEVSPRAVEFLADPTHGRVVRHLTDEDRAALKRLRESEQRELEACQGFVAHRRLQMELVDVEHLFGGERIVFYFLAEKRVDFRELVKDLARAFQTRIEMRQIGVR